MRGQNSLLGCILTADFSFLVRQNRAATTYGGSKRGLGVESFLGIFRDQLAPIVRCFSVSTSRRMTAL